MRGMGWDGMGWDGMGWDGMEWNGMLLNPMCLSRRKLSSRGMHVGIPPIVTTQEARLRRQGSEVRYNWAGPHLLAFVDIFDVLGHVAGLDSRRSWFVLCWFR
jgi:hypothetical protein